MPTTVSSRRIRSTHLLSAYYSGNQHNDNRWLKQRHFCQCVSPSKAAGSNSFSDIIPNGYTEYARELNFLIISEIIRYIVTMYMTITLCYKLPKATYIHTQTINNNNVTTTLYIACHVNYYSQSNGIRERSDEVI